MIESGKCSAILGTALWGWKVSKSDAFSLLDLFANKGGRIVDTASNYPINKSPEDMGLAVKWIGEWLQSNPSADIGVWLKMGATDNLGGALPNLSYDYLTSVFEASQLDLDGRIQIAGIHWDNRTAENAEEIAETICFFKDRRREGLHVALSGVKSPAEYHRLWPEEAERWFIQVKDNALTSDARKHYSNIFPRANYYAYGVNMGGVKNSGPIEAGSSLALRGLSHNEVVDSIEAFLQDATGVTPEPRSFNDVALMRVFLINQLSGVILGPSNTAQLDDSLSFISRLSSQINSTARDRLATYLSLDEYY